MEDELIKKIKTIQDKYVEQTNKDMEGMTVPEQKIHKHKERKNVERNKRIKKRYKELKHIF